MSDDTERRDVLRLDASTAKLSDEGFLTVKARVTRTGIMEYHRGGRVVRELRRPDQVFRQDSLATLGGVPITRGSTAHPVPFVTAADTQAHAVGYVMPDVRADGGRFVDATLRIWRQDAVKAVMDGDLSEISAGYRAKAGPGGEWQGQRYDLEQTDIRYNHVTLLAKGAARGGSEMAIRLDGHDLITLLRERLGEPSDELAVALGLPDADGVRLLLDGHLGTPSEAVLTRAAGMIHMPVADLIAMVPAPAAPPQNPRVSRMKRNIVIGGVTFPVEIADDLAPALESAEASEAKVRTDAADAGERIKAVEAERDELRTRCDSLEAAQAGVKRDLSLAAAKPVFADAAGDTARAVQEATIKHLGHGDELRADATDAEVAGMFAVAVKSAKPAQTPAAPAPVPTETRTDSDDDSPSEAARKRMLERTRDAWKGTN